MPQNPPIVTVKTTAIVTHNGERVSVRRGDAWAGDDPLVKAHPELFTADPSDARRTEAPVEQATAAPGERRGTRRA